MSSKLSLHKKVLAANGEVDSPSRNVAAKVSSTSSKTSTGSSTGPHPYPRSILRKNSPLGGSANGLNTSKTGPGKTPFNGQVAAAILSTTNPTKRAPSGKVQAQGLQKTATGAKNPPESKKVVIGTTSSFQVKHLSNQKEDETGRVYGEVVEVDMFDTRDSRSSPPNEIEEKEEILPKFTNGGAQIGLVQKFLAKEVGRSNSLPSGVGNCGQAENFPTTPQNSDRMSMANNFNPNMNQQMCGPACHRLHFCLQQIPQVSRIPNNSHFSPSHYSSMERLDMNKDNLWKFGSLNDRNSNNESTSTVQIGKETSMQEAFSSLLIIRNLANESGICSLEDHRNIASIEALILKIFSRTASNTSNKV